MIKNDILSKSKPLDGQIEYQQGMETALMTLSKKNYIIILPGDKGDQKVFHERFNYPETQLHLNLCNLTKNSEGNPLQMTIQTHSTLIILILSLH